MVASVMPESRSGLNGVVVLISPVFAPDFREMLDESDLPERFVRRLANAFRNGIRNPDFHPIRYLELLILLWADNLILFPTDFRCWVFRQKWDVLRNEQYSKGKAHFIKLVTEVLMETNARDFKGRAYGLLTSSSLKTERELSLGLIDAYESLLQLEVSALNGPALATARSFNTRVGQTYRLLFNQAHPLLAVAVTATRTPKKTKDSKFVKTNGQFFWLEHASFRLAGWADLMRRYVAQSTNARTTSLITRLNCFADYLLTLENPPSSPMELVRAEHIYDATLVNGHTYCEYLRKRLGNGDSKSSLSLLRRFLDWYSDYRIALNNTELSAFINPVRPEDSTGTHVRGYGQTSREALPSYVIEELKALLLEDDFAFGRSQRTQYVRVLDSATEKVVRTWFPAQTICLYLMLETPVRSHQARWIDSGDLDEFVYDNDVKRMVRNPSPHAIVGRREAVLRLQHDILRKADWFGMWVNTNKTAAYDGSNVGYCVPYVSDRLTTLLQDMRAWQMRYNRPMKAPIAYYGEKYTSEERKKIAEKGPQVVPLFRDPAQRRHQAPINYDRLVTFYVSALAEVQARIKRKYGHDIHLVKESDNGTLKWTVDLHTLRVSGITAMIENGVPLEVVSQFVAGHATLVMTLHYLKYSPVKLRKMLKDAHEKALENIDFVGSEIFMQNLDTFAPFMLTQVGAGQGAGVGALRERTGIFTINSEGICPGTSCSTGGPLDTTRVMHGPVPGGQRCGLCRYWITGPAHLLGQVAAVNNLAYMIRKKGQEVAKLNDERIDAEDAGDQKKARQIRDRVDVLNRELAIDVEEWTARYRYAEQSVSQLNAYLETKAKLDGQDLPVPLLTAGTAAELKVTLEEAHEFALLDHISQMADFVTGFRNRGAELEKNAILSKMLAANGVKPFLFKLSDEQAHEAGNLLSALLLQQVKHRDLDDVLSGRTKLSAYPHLEERLKALESAVDEGTDLALDMDLLSIGDNYDAVTDNDGEARFA